MPAVSTIGPHVRKAVIDGLKSHLEGLPDFNGQQAREREVEVAYGYDFGSDATERVYLGDWRAETPPAALRSGRNTRNETGTFELLVFVKYVGGDAYDADLRAAAIGGACEDWLAERKSNGLGVTGLLTLTVRDFEAGYRGIADGTASLITYTVRWTARLE